MKSAVSNHHRIESNPTIESQWESEDLEVLSKIKGYCFEHGLDFRAIYDVLNEPKVVPMIRGIGYEYVVKSALEKILVNDDRFICRKTIVNPQLTVQGTDMDVFDKQRNKVLNLECKLAKNGSFTVGRRGSGPNCKIKVMRSRTLGVEVMPTVSRDWGVTIEQLSAHKDNYLGSKFDYVVTNIRNAFYVTMDDETFRFQPNEQGWSFLESYFNTRNHDEIDNLLKNLHFYARAIDLTPKVGGFNCTRRGCPNPTTCEFIPNYPTFNLAESSSLFNQTATNAWKPLANIRTDMYQLS
jgi:hypothetical protein